MRHAVLKETIVYMPEETLDDLEITSSSSTTSTNTSPLSEIMSFSSDSSYGRGYGGRRGSVMPVVTASGTRSGRMTVTHSRRTVETRTTVTYDGGSGRRSSNTMMPSRDYFTSGRSLIDRRPSYAGVGPPSPPSPTSRCHTITSSRAPSGRRTSNAPRYEQIEQPRRSNVAQRYEQIEPPSSRVRTVVGPSSSRRSNVVQQGDQEAGPYGVAQSHVSRNDQRCLNWDDGSVLPEDSASNVPTRRSSVVRATAVQLPRSSRRDGPPVAYRTQAALRGPPERLALPAPPPGSRTHSATGSRRSSVAGSRSQFAGGSQTPTVVRERPPSAIGSRAPPPARRPSNAGGRRPSTYY